MSSTPSIKYNRQLKVAAAGPSPWTKLGPEEWFDNYRIITVNDYGFTASYLLKLTEDNNKAQEYRKTSQIINSSEFINLTKNEMSDYRFVLNRPIELSGEIPDKKIISNDVSYARFENKRVFRETFSNSVQIPGYIILRFDEVMAKLYDLESFWTSLTLRFGKTFVLQDELGGGGRGTYIITSISELKHAISILKDEIAGEYVVISEYINGYERSMQALVGKNGVFLGPLQQQLVRNSELLDPKDRNGMHFCGGKFIEFSEMEKTHLSINDNVLKIGKMLQRAGYRGMFGVDFIVTDDDQVFTLEINARTTGLLALLNEQKSEHPLYLLHILELLGEDYSMMGKDNETSEINGPSSFIMVFNKSMENSYLPEIKTGNYSYDPGNNTISIVSENCRWESGSDLLIQLCCSKVSGAKYNQAMCSVYSKQPLFDDSGKLSEGASRIVQLIRDSAKSIYE